MDPDLGEGSRTAAVRASAVGVGVSRAFRCVLARARQPFWAGTSAAIVCQPQLGASLRKGWFRMIGTVIGATMIVVLTAWFPQDRIAFLVLLALWCGICAFVARCSATSRPTRRRSPATPRQSSPPTTSARPEARVRTSSCWRSGAPARSASGSRAPVSCWPGPISAAPSGGSQVVRQSGGRDHGPIYPHAGACGAATAGHAKPSGANSSGASSRSTR